MQAYDAAGGGEAGALAALQEVGPDVLLAAGITITGAGAIKVGGKLVGSASDAYKHLKATAGMSSAGLVSKNAVVLGKYPDYINLSNELNAKRFEIPTDVWNKMSNAERWTANTKFLDRAISRGDDIVLSNPVGSIDEATGYYKLELDYLNSKGYTLSNDGKRMLK